MDKDIHYTQCIYKHWRKKKTMLDHVSYQELEYKYHCCCEELCCVFGSAPWMCWCNQKVLSSDFLHKIAHEKAVTEIASMPRADHNDINTNVLPPTGQQLHSLSHINDTSRPWPSLAKTTRPDATHVYAQPTHTQTILHTHTTRYMDHLHHPTITSIQMGWRKYGGRMDQVFIQTPIQPKSLYTSKQASTQSKLLWSPPNIVYSYN